MKTKTVPWRNVDIDGGFWKIWQETNANVIVHSLFRQFKETGRIDAMRLVWKEGMPKKPHVFWDSDVAKWIEGAAYILHYKEDEELKAMVEEVIDSIEAGQDESGYFNSYFLTVEPENRFTDRTAHELYTAGHLIEAASAYFYACGDDRFLKIMMRFADCIERVFVTEATAAFKTPGHEEIELALVRLWEATGQKRYLDLSKHFVDVRGTDSDDKVFSVLNGTAPACPKLRCHLRYNDTYAQDDAPARQLSAAAGHAVRAMYFYSAMSDISREFDDQDLYEACIRLWDDATLRKMYITGGVSAERYGEAIGPSYALPNINSYAETCASVAMVFFGQRMLLLDADSKYSDIIEKQMYNGALAGLAINGESFFYENPLESRPALKDFYDGINAPHLFPNYRRQGVFDCSCCPPNILRFIASLGGYLYTVKNNVLFIHQYAQSTATVDLCDSKVSVRQITDYPWSGGITIEIDTKGLSDLTVALRLPGWCKNPGVSVNGDNVYADNFASPNVTVKKGYLYISGIWEKKNVIALDFPMSVVEMEANPKVAETCGKVAIMRGPIVYCLEAADNNTNLFDLTLPEKNVFKCETARIGGLDVVQISGSAFIRKPECRQQTLYKEYDPQYMATNFTAIPYFAWANREPGDMVVWLKKH